MTQISINNYNLDEEQLKPILENPKYSIIIAGAGSGKTLTIIGKIKYLLENKIYKPEEICCISFTNEATDNLSKNITQNCGHEIPAYTFHKLALKILKQQNINFKIEDATLLPYIVDEFFESMCFGNKELIKCTFKHWHCIFNNSKTWRKLIKSSNFKQEKNTIITFINQFNCNINKIEKFIEYIKSKENRNIMLIIYAIFLIYKTEKESKNTIDFDDMIIKATEILQTKKCTFPFKLIIIDEFQDTSIARFQLIKELVKQNNASLCVVGDDYQSIYHFSGCDLSIFLNFQNFFPNTQTYKLQKTYRNSQELINLAGKFIQKNPYQIKKELYSNKHLNKPIKLIYYTDESKILEKVLSLITNNKSILILGRNNFDLKKYTQNLTYQLLDNKQIIFKKFPDYNIKFLTIHSAKGLESDKVILLNVSHEIYGIPSLKKEEKILHLIKKAQNYPQEEERRLFYVALTRTKEEIYLLIPKQRPSKFIKEIKKDNNTEKIKV